MFTASVSDGYYNRLRVKRLLHATCQKPTTIGCYIGYVSKGYYIGYMSEAYYHRLLHRLRVKRLLHRLRVRRLLP